MKFTKQSDEVQFTTSLQPPHLVKSGSAQKPTPTGSAHSTTESPRMAFGSVSHNERLHTTSSSQSPSSANSGSSSGLKLGGSRGGGGGLASRIKNFEPSSEVGGGGRGNERGRGGERSQGFGKRTKSIDNDIKGSRGGLRPQGRVVQARVPVQIGASGSGGGETERAEKEKDERKKREEEMRKNRAEEDRKQRERRAREQKVKDDYENVDLGPPIKATPRPPETTPPGPRLVSEQPGGRNNAMAYENVPLIKTQRSPKNPRSANKEPPKQTRPLVTVGGASTASPAPRRHQYENITILTESGPIPFHLDISSSEEEGYSGDECPAPQEVIYENFGADSGNQPMTADEIERHLEKKDKRGISAEYLRIKNEPLVHSSTACK